MILGVVIILFIVPCEIKNIVLYAKNVKLTKNINFNNAICN